MFKGYCFDKDGWHTPAVDLLNEEAAVNYAVLQKGMYYEVRIVDPSDDSIVLQIIEGVVVFPKID